MQGGAELAVGGQRQGRRWREGHRKVAQRTEVSATHLALEDDAHRYRAEEERAQEQARPERRLSHVEEPLDPEDREKADHRKGRGDTAAEPRRWWSFEIEESLGQPPGGRQWADGAPEGAREKKRREYDRLPDGPDEAVCEPSGATGGGSDAEPDRGQKTGE